MQNSNDSKPARLQEISQFCAWFVIVLAGCVLTGWVLDIPSLQSLLPGSARMKPNAAVGFLLAGAALLAGAKSADEDASIRRHGSLVLALLVILLGLLTIGEHLLDKDIGIDRLIGTAPPADSIDARSGRMAFATALGFVMIGLALVLGDTRWRGAGQALALFAHIIGLLALLGYLYDARSLYGDFAYSSVALPTALAFMVISAGVLLSRSQVGMVGMVFGATAGGVLARRLLPLAILAPLLVGWLHIQADRRGILDPELGVAIVQLTFIILFSTFILRTADVLRRGEDRRLAAEEALSARETQLRIFIEHAPASLAMFDCDMCYLAVSRRWLDDYALGNRDILGQCHYDIFPDLPERWREAHRRGLAGEVVRADEDPFVRANGNVLWLRWEVRPWRLANGEVGGIVIFTEDISHLKVAERNLRLSRQDLQQAQKVGKIGSWRLDVRRNELTWSPENHRIFGVEEGTEMTYEFFLSRVHPDDRAYVDSEWKAALRGSPYDIEHRLLVDGEVKWVRERAELEFAIDGSLQGGFGTTQDISDRKILETRLLKALDDAHRQTRAKSAFLATMSHEIRTPLNVIIGLGQLLRREITNPGQVRKLEQLAANSDHLLAVINDILEFSKIEAEKIELNNADFLLGMVIKRVTRMLEGRAREKGLSLITNASAAVYNLRLEGDALRLAQILINLCSNAIKFTDQGTVTMSIACLSEDERSVSLHFSIADTGCGITREDQQYLFQPFMQGDSAIAGNHGGTGLGLAISQRLVALMGGRIEVASRPGGGSTFSFEIALKRAAARVAIPIVAAPGCSFQGRRLLVAEDHPQSQEILLEMLEDLGCEVDIASDGAEAVECAQTRAYDLILMDMQMPRMDGIAATRAIRALPGHSETPIVALTANAFAEDRERCLAAGMTAHLAKPVTTTVLAAALSQRLSPAAVLHPETSSACALPDVLQHIPGLEIASVWRRSPEQVEAYCEQLQRFATGHAEDMSRLRLFLAAGEQMAARSVAHSLKGVAGLLGVTRVASLAEEIEQLLATGSDSTRTLGLAGQCETELANLAEALRHRKRPQE